MRNVPASLPGTFCQAPWGDRKEQLDLLFCHLLVGPAQTIKINVLRDRIAPSWLKRALWLGCCSKARVFCFTLCSGDAAAAQVATHSGFVPKKKKVWGAPQTVILYVVCINVTRYKVPVIALKT